MTAQTQVAWRIWLHGRHIDTVFYTSDCDADYILRSLINHDGYSPDICIRPELS